jgi:hypothetical protein
VSACRPTRSDVSAGNVFLKQFSDDTSDPFPFRPGNAVDLRIIAKPFQMLFVRLFFFDRDTSGKELPLPV